MTTSTDTDIRVNFMLADGSQRSLVGRPYQTVRELAMYGNIPGLVGSCGGCAMCGTCHVYVGPDWENRLEPRKDIEELGLDMAYDVRDGSRLSCQIVLKPEMDGLTVTIAENYQ